MRLIWGILALVTVALASPAHAQTEEKEAKAHFARGKQLIKLNKYAEAIGELEQAYKLDPKNDHLFNLGVAYHLKGDRKAALDYYRRYLATQPKGRAARDAERYATVVEGEIAAEEEAVKKSDSDGDGVPKSQDNCLEVAEDRDGFQDDDGCPEPDNDRDGLPDAGDRCPNEAEDKDLHEDDDGCPEPDNDGDGIPDAADKCTMQAEDKDGFKDDDGCPDADADNDGVEEPTDRCPAAPEDRDGYKDDDGCPDIDNDQDGFRDDQDLCPDIVGKKRGCVPDKTGIPALKWIGMGVTLTGFVAIGLGVNYGVKARDASDEVSNVTGMWTTELDDRVQEGKDADKNMRLFLIGGSATVVVGSILWIVGISAGGGEIHPTVSKDRAGLTWTRRF